MKGGASSVNLEKDKDQRSEKDLQSPKAKLELKAHHLFGPQS